MLQANEAEIGVNRGQTPFPRASGNRGRKSGSDPFFGGNRGQTPFSEKSRGRSLSSFHGALCLAPRAPPWKSRSEPRSRGEKLGQTVFVSPLSRSKTPPVAPCRAPLTPRTHWRPSIGVRITCPPQFTKDRPEPFRQRESAPDPHSLPLAHPSKKGVWRPLSSARSQGKPLGQSSLAPSQRKKGSDPDFLTPISATDFPIGL